MRRPLLSGAVAGACGGAAMALWSVTHSAAEGLGALLPAKAVAASLFGPEALIGGAGMVGTGAGLHLATAGGWGFLYSLFLPERIHPGLSTGLGAGFGLLVLAFMTWGILPWMDPVLGARVEWIPTSWALAHVVFGATTGLLVPILRGDRRSDPVEAF